MPAAVVVAALVGQIDPVEVEVVVGIKAVVEIALVDVELIITLLDGITLLVVMVLIMVFSRRGHAMGAVVVAKTVDVMGMDEIEVLMAVMVVG